MPLNPTLLTTILVPCIWGTTYIIFTQTLPVDHPLLVGALRALPAGLLLMALGPGLLGVARGLGHQGGVGELPQLALGEGLHAASTITSAMVWTCSGVIDGQ